MKKTSVLLFAVAVMLSSCGIMAQQSSADSGHQFQDGIYSSSPSFISRNEKEVSQQKTEELVQKTKSSEIYLLGDKKDTIMIPENMSARIQLNNQKVGGTVITVGENPYDWRWDLENNYGYYYGPYSLGSSWYWSRHYSPYWSSWSYSPWYYGSWYYTGWYDPWYYNPWYGSSWYFGLGYYGGWYGCYDPWYYSWHDPWHHYHHHHHGWYNPHHHHRPSHGHGPGHITVKPGGNKNRYTAPRAHTNGSSLRRNDSRQSGGQSATASRTSTTVRRGIGTSSSTSRNASVSRGSSSSTSRSATTSRSGSTTYRRPASSASSSSSASSGSNSSSGSSYNRSSSGYSRSSSYSGGGGYSRSSSSSGGGGYSRSSSSSGSYRR